MKQKRNSVEVAIHKLHRRNSKADYVYDDDNDNNDDDYDYGGNRVVHVVRPVDSDPYDPPTRPLDSFKSDLDLDVDTIYHPLKPEKSTTSTKTLTVDKDGIWDYDGYGWSPTSHFLLYALATILVTEF